MIPSFPELWTVAPNHCFDLSSIMVPEALLFPAKIELKVHILSQVKKQNLSIKKDQIHSEHFLENTLQKLKNFSILTLRKSTQNSYHTDFEFSIPQNILSHCAYTLIFSLFSKFLSRSFPFVKTAAIFPLRLSSSLASFL